MKSFKNKKADSEMDNLLKWVIAAVLFGLLLWAVIGILKRFGVL